MMIVPTRLYVILFTIMMYQNYITSAEDNVTSIKEPDNNQKKVGSTTLSLKLLLTFVIFNFTIFKKRK